MSSRLDVVTFGESMVLQMHDGRGKNHQAYLWQYSHPAGPVVFDFRLGREREGPKQFLGNFEGLLQSDGYGAYDHIGGPKLVHAARFHVQPRPSAQFRADIFRSLQCHREA